MFTCSKYENRGGSPTFAAQRNLAGRTHYVDSDSLRFHKSKIRATYVVDDGWLLVESVGLDMDNTRRGFRYVVFDIVGNVISRVALGDCFKTRDKAVKAMWAWLDTADAKAITSEALDRAERNTLVEISRVRAQLGG